MLTSDSSVVMTASALMVVCLSLLTQTAAEDTVGQWVTDVIATLASQHNTNLVTLHTCWDTATSRGVSKQLISHGMMQSWMLDVDHLLETNYEMFVVDLDCTDSAEVLERASLLRKFTLRNKWLLLSTSLGNHSVGENVTMNAVTTKYPWIDNLLIYPDSDVALATGLRTQLVYLYRAGKDSPLKVVDKEEDRSNLERTKLVASTILFQLDRFQGFYSDLMTDIDTWPKLHYPLVVNLADQLNFNLELWSTDGYGWEENGSFTGLMGQLHRREVDFAATGFFMRADRLQVVEFTAESYHIRTAILFRQPPLSSVSNIFLLPFGQDVWVFCAIYCVSVIFIFCLEKVIARYHGDMYPMMQNASFMDIVTIVLGCICQQGSFLVPTKMSGRITLFFLSLTALFLYTSYSANIVALQQAPSSALSSLSDLVRSPLAVGIQDLEYNRIYFKESFDPDTRLLYEKKVKPRGRQAYYTPEEGIRNVRSGLFAFNVETNLGYKMISETFLDTEKCGLSEIQLFPMPTLSLPLTKRSGYRDLFTQKVRWQRETGMLHRNGLLWLPQRPKCEDVRGGTGFQSVGLMEFMPALKVFLGGLLLAVCLLILEIIYYHRKKICSSKKNTSPKDNEDKLAEDEVMWAYRARFSKKYWNLAKELSILKHEDYK